MVITQDELEHVNSEKDHNIIVDSMLNLSNVSSKIKLAKSMMDLILNIHNKSGK